MAREFEALRLRAEKHKDGRPKVFLLTYGNLATRRARAQFSGNFFACAGYAIKDNNGFKTIEEGIKAAKEWKADIVVLCSSDDEYPEIAPKAFELIKNKAILVVAGAPPTMDELRAKSIEHFIHLRSNVLETLENFHKLLGIK
jgi:methylmalonyl-CoA mutase